MHCTLSQGRKDSQRVKTNMTKILMRISFRFSPLTLKIFSISRSRLKTKDILVLVSKNEIFIQISGEKKKIRVTVFFENIRPERSKKLHSRTFSRELSILILVSLFCLVVFFHCRVPGAGEDN